MNFGGTVDTVQDAVSEQPLTKAEILDLGFSPGEIEEAIESGRVESFGKVVDAEILTLYRPA